MSCGLRSEWDIRPVIHSGPLTSFNLEHLVGQESTVFLAVIRHLRRVAVGGQEGCRNVEMPPGSRLRSRHPDIDMAETSAPHHCRQGFKGDAMAKLAFQGGKEAGNAARAVGGGRGRRPREGQEEQKSPATGARGAYPRRGEPSFLPSPSACPCETPEGEGRTSPMVRNHPSTNTTASTVILTREPSQTKTPSYHF
jgi:hypothetical protein